MLPRLIFNILFLASYAARIGQAFHQGCLLIDLWPYIGAWLSWCILIYGISRKATTSAQ